MKKGFTLIELLAVILILGIIALIAIPTVNNILKESRRGAFQSTLTNLEKAIEEKCTTEQIKNQEITNEYIITNGVISPKLDIKGSLPDGTIYVNKNCEVSYTLSDNNYTGTKEVGGEVVIGEKGSTTTVYREAILNGTDPVLSNNLIPVTIDNDGTVRKADLNSKWYSYAEKKWANAVILSPTGKVEDDGTILEDSIESYFVWIPRYKYKLFDMGNYDGYLEETPTESNSKTIEIVFENKNTPVSVGTEVGQYHSHPAFQAFDLNGLWVGKFETTGSTSSVTIKPNKYSIRSTKLNIMFERAYNYKRDNESHMMKNTEWGAVTYLTLSKYGINKKTNINNNNLHLTGYGATPNTNQSSHPGTYGSSSDVTLPYNTESGYQASTTGNITGIYDMRGNSSEYVAAYIDGYLGSSGFTEDPVSLYGSKYFDVYSSEGHSKSFKNRILGDATGEFGPFYISNVHVLNNWFKEYAKFASSDAPWFLRGGAWDNGLLAGQLKIDGFDGSSNQYVGFRIVLSN